MVEQVRLYRFFWLAIERLQVNWQTLFLGWPGQIAFEKVQHVVLREAVTLDLLVRPIDLLNDLVGYIAGEDVLEFQLALALGLAPSLLISCLLSIFRLCFIYLHLFDHRWGLFLELLHNIHIVLIFFVQLLVNNLLELTAAGLCH